MIIMLEKDEDVVEKEEKFEMESVDTHTGYVKDSDLRNAFHNAGLVIDDKFEDEMVELLYKSSLRRFIEMTVNNIKTDAYCVNAKHSSVKEIYIKKLINQIQSYVSDCRLIYIGYTMYCNIKTGEVWHRYYARIMDNEKPYYSCRNQTLLYFIASIYNDIYGEVKEPSKYDR